ncbi:uncharacterized protein Z519_11666 [Cladophialophora bantiana CBS 173.52]|uniref:Uncharacterized protein n=1 Tax=Cladophialophora bantiana (strain ATCC 10958 / CBS 173.52 / CDC B-1940 / NIH 8579) TaxID=1442370 RepID=A0A0D2FLU3_CLAB1|nr:uncharacterized protein Z519_11666 [Cladophialophora bantiana CBS 173.52]KIW87692.1 hypothetical protein Z519_11666 [Cladophialophora bantiana CBS 173.52]
MHTRKDRQSSPYRGGNDRDVGRDKVQRHQVLAGHVFFLPRKRQIERARLRNSSIADGCFYHPVLIIRVDDHTDEIKMLTITSFDGKGLESRHFKDASRRRRYLPIYPSPAHPESHNITLYLAGNAELPKLSWVNTHNEIVADWRVLKPFKPSNVQGKRLYLTAASYENLLQHIVDPNSPPKPFGLTNKPQNLLLLMPHSLPARFQALPNHVEVASRSGITNYPRQVQSTLSRNRYTPQPSPLPTHDRLPPPQLQPQSSFTSSTPPLPGPLTKPVKTQQDRSLLSSAGYYYYHHQQFQYRHQHQRERQPLLQTTLTPHSTTRTQASGDYPCALSIIVIPALFVLAYVIYRLVKIIPGPDSW